MSDSEDGIPDVAETWVEETTAFDRVRSVSRTIDEPHTAPEIAEEACVSPNTARNHLQRLVDLRVVVDVGESTSRYRPNPLYDRFAQMHDLLQENDRDDLIERRAEQLDRADAIEEEYGTLEPGDLRVRAATADGAEETRRLRKAASETETVLYRLHLLEHTIERYDDLNRHIV